MILETERLIIRPPEDSDLDSCKAIWTDPVVRQFSGGVANPDEFLFGFLDDLQSKQRPYGFNTVIEKSTNVHIGDSGLIQKTIAGVPEIEIVYFYNKKYWGHGYATEAAKALLDFGANVLKLKRVIALIHPENVASIRVAEKLGLSYEKDFVTESGNFRKLYSGPVYYNARSYGQQS